MILLIFGLFIVTSVWIEKWSGDILAYFNLNCFVQRGKKNILHSQRSINVILPSVSAADGQVERYEQIQPKVGAQIQWYYTR